MKVQLQATADETSQATDESTWQNLKNDLQNYNKWNFLQKQ